jgi:hypothetical protein
VIAGWAGARLGSPIVGHWFEKVKIADILLGRRLAGEAVGLSACLVFCGTKVNLPTMGVKVYHGMAVAVLTLHLLWIFWVICGALLTRHRRALRWLHIISLVYSVLIEALPWPPCPLTLLEAWLEARAGVTPYHGSFLVHCLEAIVYPDIPVSWVIAGAVVVCAFNLGVYAFRYYTRPDGGW